ncbi:hypothetical protein M4368_31355, partial [Pseudomonas aeruginosa PA103]
MNGFTECDLENEKSARGRSSSVGRINASRLSGRFGYDRQGSDLEAVHQLAQAPGLGFQLAAGAQGGL